MRRDYLAAGLDSDLEPGWLADGWAALLRAWIVDAESAGVAEPNAMVLGTVDEQGHPVTRTVLCKGLTSHCVMFFTNVESDKGRQLQAHPYAALTFAWPEIGRQVNLRGPAGRVNADETARYWASRPRGSRLGAWSSQQSRTIESRADLDSALSVTESRFAEVEDIPVPPFWGGYRVQPDIAEFWQGRTNRLHNRIRAVRGESGWVVQRLQP